MNFKNALLAAVATLGVAGTAQAADLAKKAPAAANYVKVCDAYGAGFFYIPGSETCLQIGGYVRAEYYALSNSRDWGDTTGWGGVGGRTKNGILTHARADLTLDARTATEMGLLRSFIDIEYNYWSGGATGVTLNKAFIQFGGLTAGRATSFFDFWTGNTYGAWFEPAHSDSNINLLAYTFSFGNGISASLSIEDPSSGSAGRRTVAAGFPDTGYAGVKYPDLVGNVNITQAWGSAQIMGALHNNNSAASFGGVDDAKLGYAIGAGVTVNLPMLGAGDTASLQAAYAKGAVAYVSPSWSGLLADQFNNGGSIGQSTSWSVAAGLTHNWTKTVATSLEGSYAKYEIPGGARDFAQIDLQGNVVWTPVTGLSIGAEVEYRKVDYKSSAIGADADALVGLIRVQRSF